MDGLHPLPPSDATKVDTSDKPVVKQQSLEHQVVKPQGSSPETSATAHVDLDDSDFALQERTKCKRTEIAQFWLNWRCVCRGRKCHDETAICPKAQIYRLQRENVFTLRRARWAIRVLNLTSPRLAEYFWADTGTGILIWFFGQLISSTLQLRARDTVGDHHEVCGIGYKVMTFH